MSQASPPQTNEDGQDSFSGSKDDGYDESAANKHDELRCCFKGALVDPTQCRFLNSWGVTGKLTDDGWKKIGAECAEKQRAHSPPYHFGMHFAGRHVGHFSAVYVT